MSLNIDLYKERLEAYKISGKSGKVDSIKKSIIDNFYNNPSYFSVLVNDVERDVHIVTDNNKQFKVLCKPNETISTGNYVVWNDKTFLCTSVNENDSVQSKGILQKTNHILKWINSTNTLITKPCIMSIKTLYTTGVKDEKIIEIPNGMVGIQLPYDDDAKHLKRDDSFVFNDSKYKITLPNKVEFPGLLVLICEEMPISETDDDIINEIADRYINGIDRLEPEPDPDEPDPDPTPTDTTYTITAQMPYPNDPDNEIFWEDVAIYTVHKFVDGIEVAGNFTFTITNTNIAKIINITDNSVSVQAINKKYGTFKLIAADVDTSEIAIEKEIRIIGM